VTATVVNCIGASVELFSSASVSLLTLLCRPLVVKLLRTVVASNKTQFYFAYYVMSQDVGIEATACAHSADTLRYNSYTATGKVA